MLQSIAGSCPETTFCLEKESCETTQRAKLIYFRVLWADEISCYAACSACKHLRAKLIGTNIFLIVCAEPDKTLWVLLMQAASVRALF